MNTPKVVVKNTRKDRSGSGKGNDSEQSMQESFEARNKAVEFSVLVETGCNLGNNLQELKAAKRKLFGDFQRHCDGDREKAKARVRLYKNHKKKEEVESDTDLMNEFVDSQESTLEELYDLDVDIEGAKADIQTLKVKKGEARKGLQRDASTSKSFDR